MIYFVVEYIIYGKMVKIEEAKKEFAAYVEKFDLNNEPIKRKVFHTYRVMELCEEIAKSLQLNNEQIKLATMIGLFHDIARFEQYKKYNTFNDLKSIDHGEYAIEILNKNNFIERFVDDEQHKDIIKLSINNHNKYEIKQNLNAEEMMYAKIIRDADKLDIMYESLNMFFKTEEEKEKIENGVISKKIMWQICNGKTILREKNFDEIDRFFVYVAFVFDLNYKYTFQVLKEENYINKMLEQFEFRNVEMLENLEKIKKIINEYVNKNVMY